jgi:hypothetical protein
MQNSLKPETLTGDGVIWWRLCQLCLELVAHQLIVDGQRGSTTCHVRPPPQQLVHQRAQRVQRVYVELL